MMQTLNSKIRILGIPMDLGQERRGVDMGPSAMRYAGLFERLQALGYEVVDAGNIPVPGRDEPRVQEHLWVESGCGGMRHLPEVIAAGKAIYDVARECAFTPEIPLFLGGDHSIAIGTVGGTAAAGPIGVVWVDAHGDFNTPDTSPSGNIHGMPLAALTGHGCADLINLGHPGPKVQPEHVCMIGIRDLDPGERLALANCGVRVWTMRDIDEKGMAAVARAALEALADVPRLHVSLDMDSIDPGVTPGVGTPVPGGLTFREAHLLMEILAESGKVDAIDVVEINPILDHGNTTAEMAVALVASLLGQRIL